MDEERYDTVSSDSNYSLSLSDFLDSDEENNEQFEEYVDDSIIDTNVQGRKEGVIEKEKTAGKGTELADSDELKSIGKLSEGEKDNSNFLKFNEVIDFSKPMDLKLEKKFCFSQCV